MIAIAKIDTNNNASFLYKDRHEIYTFATTPNVFFNTEEEAKNFIYYNYDKIKSKIFVDERLFIISVNNKNPIIRYWENIDNYEVQITSGGEN